MKKILPVLCFLYTTNVCFAANKRPPLTAATPVKDLGTNSTTSDKPQCENAPVNPIEIRENEAVRNVDVRCYARAILDSLDNDTITFRPEPSSGRRDLRFKCVTGILQVTHNNEATADRSTWTLPWKVICAIPAQGKPSVEENDHE